MAKQEGNASQLETKETVAVTGDKNPIERSASEKSANGTAHHDAKQHHESGGKQAKKGKKQGSRTRTIIMSTLLIGVLAFGVNYGYHELVFNQSHEETDDAQVDGNIDPVLPRIAGYVASVLVNDNVPVKENQVLVKLDSADLYLKVEAAESSVKNAEASLTVAQANVNTAKVNVEKTQIDLSRDTKLLASGAITQQQFDQTKAASDLAQAQITAATQMVAVANSQIAQKRVDLDQAKLQLTYTTVKAPADGRISRKNVQVGQYVQIGQPLMAVTESDSIWITANFKETQVSDIRPGQPVDLQIDAYPKTVFHGKVQSFAAATGAKFSLLPPDNATGNFVKVVQRVPVKILVTDSPNPNMPLRPGMSVDAVVTTKSN